MDSTNTSVRALLARKKPFRIMDLPAELRWRIYEYVLATPVCLDHKFLRRWNQKHQCEITSLKSNAHFAPLLQTCQKVRLEAELLWYSTALFDYILASLQEFKDFVGDERASKISYCRMADAWSTGDSAWAWLSATLAKQQARGYTGVLEAIFEDRRGRRAVTSISPDTAYSYLEEGEHGPSVTGKMIESASGS